MLATANPSLPAGGIRQLDIRKDLAAVADLIAEAFAGELDAQGRSSLRELRMLSRLGPLLYLLVPASGELGAFFRGFVWEDDGQVVGNVTMHQVSYGRQIWMISNVAVRRSHRGRGIARRLMEGAEARIRQLGGRWIVLQVRADNPPARTLYQHMGYEDLYSETHLRCYPEAVPPPLPLPDPDMLRPLPPASHHLLNPLLHTAIPETARWWQHSATQRFRKPTNTGMGLRLRQKMGWEHRMRWGLFRDERLQGILEVHVNPGKEHHIDMVLHPDLRAAWTRPLLAYGLRQLQPYGPQATTALFFDYQPAAIATLQSFGFQIIRRLISMRKAL